MAYLSKTTIYELAALADELEIGENIAFSVEDPEELNYYGLESYEWYLIWKVKLLYEEDYVFVIGLLNGHCTVAKDIHIISDGNIDDEDSRVEGLEEFIEEYYETYVPHNKKNEIYLVYRDTTPEFDIDWDNIIWEEE